MNISNPCADNSYMKCIDADIFRKKTQSVDDFYNNQDNSIALNDAELGNYIKTMNILTTAAKDQNIPNLQKISGLKEIYVVSEYWVCIKEPFKEKSDEVEYIKTMKDGTTLNKPELCICNIDNISNREKSPITFDIFTKIGESAPYLVDEPNRIYHYFYTKDRIEYSGGNLPTTNTTMKHHKKYTYKKHSTI